MLIPLVTAAALLAGAQAQAFQPPDCVRAVPAHTENGRMVVRYQSKPGLWLASPRGKILRRVTRKSDWWAKFSPDGRKLAFTRDRRGKSAIVTLDIASGRTRELFVTKPSTDRHIESVKAPLWSADGKTIAFMHHTLDGDESWIDVEMMRTDGSERHAVHRVSQHAAPVPTLAWSPNGRCIAYEWGGFSGGAVAVAVPDFTELFNLVPFPTTMPDGVKVFAPFGAEFGADGRRLYVTYIESNQDSDERIY
jgi:dipeptidyl aminopeptidase/acylaminoacyl peptidase